MKQMLMIALTWSVTALVGCQSVEQPRLFYGRGKMDYRPSLDRVIVLHGFNDQRSDKQLGTIRELASFWAETPVNPDVHLTEFVANGLAMELRQVGFTVYREAQPKLENVIELYGEVTRARCDSIQFGARGEVQFRLVAKVDGKALVDGEAFTGSADVHHVSPSLRTAHEALRQALYQAARSAVVAVEVDVHDPTKTRAS